MLQNFFKLLHTKTPQLVLSDTYIDKKLKIELLYIVQKDNINEHFDVEGSYYRTSDAIIALKLHINVLF